MVVVLRTSGSTTVAFFPSRESLNSAQLDPMLQPYNMRRYDAPSHTLDPNPAVAILNCAPFWRRFGLRCGRHVWIVKDVCGIICCVLTYMLILYATFVVMYIIMPSIHGSWLNFVNGLIFYVFASLAFASHVRTVVTDPVSMRFTFRALLTWLCILPHRACILWQLQSFVVSVHYSCSRNTDSSRVSPALIIYNFFYNNVSPAKMCSLALRILLDHVCWLIQAWFVFSLKNKKSVKMGYL